jgi:hypothetical protein
MRSKFAIRPGKAHVHGGAQDEAVSEPKCAYTQSQDIAR